MTRPSPEISLLRAHAGPEQGTISVRIRRPVARRSPQRPGLRLAARGRRPSDPSRDREDTTLRSPGEMKDQSRQALYPQAQARMPYKRKIGMNNQAARRSFRGGSNTARYCNSHGSFNGYWGYNAGAEALPCEDCFSVCCS